MTKHKRKRGKRAASNDDNEMALCGGRHRYSFKDLKANVENRLSSRRFVGHFESGVRSTVRNVYDSTPPSFSVSSQTIYLRLSSLTLTGVYVTRLGA